MEPGLVSRHPLMDTRTTPCFATGMPFQRPPSMNQEQRSREKHACGAGRRKQSALWFGRTATLETERLSVTLALSLSICWRHVWQGLPESALGVFDAGTA
jgi:hypothetical protein